MFSRLHCLLVTCSQTDRPLAVHNILLPKPMSFVRLHGLPIHMHHHMRMTHLKFHIFPVSVLCHFPTARHFVHTFLMVSFHHHMLTFLQFHKPSALYMVLHRPALLPTDPPVFQTLFLVQLKQIICSAMKDHALYAYGGLAIS